MGRRFPDRVLRRLAAAARAVLPARRRRARSARGRRPVRLRVLRFAVASGLAVVVLSAGVVGWYAHDLPGIEQLRVPERRPSVAVTAADGTLIATYGDLFAGPVHMEDLPPRLVQAIVATEDSHFFDHLGFDPVAILRAAYVNLTSGEIRQGGSTITQQVAKELFLSPDRTFRRKAQELILAIWLELNFTKEELFEIYVNRVYLGAGTYGVEAAARRYFDRPVGELSLHEIAVIAGLIKAPSRYAPTQAPDDALARARVVLARMVDEGYLTEVEAAEAAAAPLRLRKYASGSGVRYFTDWVIERASGFLGRTGADIVIQTTLDLAYQRAAERRLAAALEGPGARRDATQGAVVAMSPDGAVRAMVGGRDYRESQFNRATQALRQPGSAFKLFVYLAALEAGYDEDSTVTDAPVRVGAWAPQNYAGKYYGEVTLRRAFAASLNSAAVRVTESVGRDHVIEVARRLGITTPLHPNPSIALGSAEVTLIELAGAYAAVANGGYELWPYGILEIRDKDGAILFRHPRPQPGRVIRPEHVDALRDMLRTVVTAGTGRRAALDRPVAGKTGTSQDYRDAWFLGFTPDLVAGVWIGNDDGSPMDHMVGGALPAAVWREFVASTPGGADSVFARAEGGSFLSRIADAFRDLFTSASSR